MKITLEDEKYGQKVSIETLTHGLNMAQVVEQLFLPALLAMGYSQEKITEYLGEIIDEGVAKEVSEELTKKV